MRGKSLFRTGRVVSVILLLLAGSARSAAATGPAAAQPEPSPLSVGLVLPGTPTDSEQSLAVREAELASPAAVAARYESKTEFERETAAQAAATVTQAFPAFVKQQLGGPPALSPGQHLLGFTNSTTATVGLPEGNKAVIESSVPMATQAGPSEWNAVDLALQPGHNGFEPANSLTPVQIPTQLGQGAQLTPAGITVTPVDSSGEALNSSEGTITDATAFFANTQTDTDTVLKPTTRGLEVSAVLRSAASPEQLYYRVGLPAGASLVQESDGAGRILVRANGVTIAAITAPRAIDASGQAIPATIQVAGNNLTVSVPHRARSYAYPILVDPEYWLVWANDNPAQWEFHEFIGYTYGRSGSELWMKHTGSYAQEDYAQWSTWTKGYTEIYEMYAKDDMYPTYSGPETGYREATFKFQQGWIEIFRPGNGPLSRTWLSGNPYATEATVCVNGCTFSGLYPTNFEDFELSTYEPGSTPFGGSVSVVSTAIGEEKGRHSTDHFNTSSPQIETSQSPPTWTPNVLLTAAERSWLSPSQGAFEANAADGGLGVAEMKVEYDGPSGWEKVGGRNFQESSGCIGVQCLETENEISTYASLIRSNGQHLPDGADKIRVAARSPEPYTTSTEYTLEGENEVFVDAIKPHNLILSGIAVTNGTEINLGETEAHMKVEATDGETGGFSSGLKSIGLEIDGHDLGHAESGYCHPGPCTRVNEWEVNGAELGVGGHELTVVATDNAGNIETKEFQLNVSSAAPIAIGPGSVNPESGDLALESADVNMSGGMGSLEVRRHYDSRNPTEGEGGALGPQWTLSLGSLAQLEVLPDNSVLLVGPAGLTHYSLEGGHLVPPEGDRNLKLEYRPEYEGKEPAYLLTNMKEGTKTVFRLPKGSELWMPTVSNSPIPTDTTTDEYQTVEVAGKTVVQPRLELAPHPAVTCTRENMQVGCRGLELIYQGSETTAKGEAQGEWGAYARQLKEVVAIADNPSTKTVTRTAVAAYEYDSKGRLRAEWDPRISPSLKTIYGYDAEGHVTAITPPARESWIFTYGTSTGDGSPGRLLKLAHVPAKGKGAPPLNSEAPKISGSPIVGVRLAVSAGTWNKEKEPNVYAFQWEHLTALFGWQAIHGATNGNYTPTAEDYEVRARVTAMNEGGAVAAISTAVKIAASGTKVDGAQQSPQPGSTIVYEVPRSGGQGRTAMTLTEIAKWGQKDVPTEATAIFPPSKAGGWPASEYGGATIYYFDANANNTNIETATGGVSTREYNPETGAIERELDPGNRATALNETNPLAAAERLDTKKQYSEGELTDVWGPQHLVKLSSGQEVQARNHVHYSYDEGAPAGEEYGLVTRTTAGAEYEGKESDVRTTLTGYSGQEGLGWKLRVPTSTTTDPSGLDLVSKTIYNEQTGAVVETRTPGSNAETVYPPAFSFAFGSEGTGSGQFKQPGGIALDASGYAWIVDAGNNRIEKFAMTSGSATCVATYGKTGSGEVQFNEPRAIAINPTSGNVYITDKANNRVEVLSSSGTYVASVGTSGQGALKAPEGILVDGGGDIYVTDTGHNRVVEFGPDNTFVREFGTAGAGKLNQPAGIAISEGSVFVVDAANSRVAQFSLGGSYAGQFGGAGSGTGQFKEPWGITANSASGNLYIADRGNNRVEEFSSAGRPLASWPTWGPSHQLSNPIALAVTNTGTLLVADIFGAKVSAWTPPFGSAAQLNYAGQTGSAGSDEGQFSTPIDADFDGEGNLFVTDLGHNRVEKFSPTGQYLSSFGKEGSGPGQFHGPGGIAINRSTGTIYVADTYEPKVEVFNSSGLFQYSFGTEGAGKLSKPGSLTVDAIGNVWVPDMNLNKVFKYNATGVFIAAYGEEGSGSMFGSGPVQFKKPIAVAATLNGEVIAVADSANHRVEEITEQGLHAGGFAIEGQGSGELYDPEGLASDGAGHLFVVDDVAGHAEEFTGSGDYMGTYGGSGSGESQLKNPVGDAVDAAGDLAVVDTENNRVQRWSYDNPAVNYTQTIYYSPKGEASVVACRNHPEWANLPCQTGPAAEPTTPGLPPLPYTIVTYNMWDQVEQSTETFGTTPGATTRTKTTTFDAAGRPLTTEENSAVGKSLPKVTDRYNKESGALEEQSTTIGSTTKKLITAINSADLIESYTDADGNTAKYTYNEDERLSELTDSSESGKAKRTVHYDKTTGMVTELTDSGAGASGVGTFTAIYDSTGRMTSEAYPNGMTVYYTYNAVGQRVSMEYKKLTHCAEKCTWFADSIVPSIHGDTMRQSSTLSEEPSYGYDAAGRLTQVQEIPAGGGCSSRLYAYDAEGNRDSLTTRAPGAEGKCAPEGGVPQVHMYDSANRLIDGGIKYDALGDAIALPKGDAGGPGGGEELTSAYYVDDQVYRETQSGQTLEYGLDPVDRTRETVASGKTSGVTISHYDGPGSGVAWTSEAGGKSTRDISDIDGNLAELRPSTGPAVLQLRDLRGDIVATAASSETETKLLSTYNSTEFGVPTTTSPPPYAFRGAAGVKSELPSGTIVKDGRTYVPLTGGPLQTEQVALPLPENNIAPFTDAAPPGAAEDAAIAAEQAHAEQEFEENARAQAGAPCDEQAGPCPGEDDPEHGNPIYKCTLWSTWGFGVELVGHYRCALVPEVMEMQVRVWDARTGHFIEDQKGRIYWHGQGEFAPGVDEACYNGDEYDGWVYGRIWLHGKFVWSGERFKKPSQWKKCEYIPPQVVTPGGGVEEGVNSAGDPPS